MKKSAKRKLKSELKKALAALLAAGAAALYYFLSPYLAPAAPAGELEVHFIDVGQGDAILLRCDGETAVVDAGTPDCRTACWNICKGSDWRSPNISSPPTPTPTISAAWPL
jgi:hypothetical protein